VADVSIMIIFAKSLVQGLVMRRQRSFSLLLEDNDSGGGLHEVTFLVNGKPTKEGVTFFSCRISTAQLSLFVCYCPYKRCRLLVQVSLGYGVCWLDPQEKLVVTQCMVWYHTPSRVEMKCVDNRPKSRNESHASLQLRVCPTTAIVVGEWCATQTVADGVVWWWYQNKYHTTTTLGKGKGSL
jgi:hypothetical protein